MRGVREQVQTVAHAGKFHVFGTSGLKGIDDANQIMIFPQ